MAHNPHVCLGKQGATIHVRVPLVPASQLDSIREPFARLNGVMSSPPDVQLDLSLWIISGMHYVQSHGRNLFDCFIRTMPGQSATH